MHWNQVYGIVLLLNNLQLIYFGEVIQIRRNWTREGISVQPSVQSTCRAEESLSVSYLNRVSASEPVLLGIGNLHHFKCTDKPKRIWDTPGEFISVK